ncbi:hypothetical protein ACQ4PT_026891 [Festuca glaucescens]
MKASCTTEAFLGSSPSSFLPPAHTLAAELRSRALAVLSGHAGFAARGRGGQSGSGMCGWRNHRWGRGGVYDKAYAQKRIDRSDEVEENGGKLSAKLHPSGQDDMSILAMQRLNDHLPNGPTSPLDMILDYFKYDYEFAEPPRRGYEAVVYYLAGQYLKADKSGNIVDPRLQLSKVVREISYSRSGVTVKTEDNKVYKADYVMVSTSVGVLQSDLIQFKPQLPNWKVLSIYQFDMAVYTKIFVKFPKKFWPEGKGRELFLYASSRRGYYGVWQEFEAQYPDANVLLVTVTDEESRRIEQQSDNQTKAEIVKVLRDMFAGADVPDATDILVPRWWSDRFYRAPSPTGPSASTATNTTSSGYSTSPILPCF